MLDLRWLFVAIREFFSACLRSIRLFSCEDVRVNLIIHLCYYTAILRLREVEKQYNCSRYHVLFREMICFGWFQWRLHGVGIWQFIFYYPFHVRCIKQVIMVLISLVYEAKFDWMKIINKEYKPHTNFHIFLNVMSIDNNKFLHIPLLYMCMIMGSLERSRNS